MYLRVCRHLPIVHHATVYAVNALPASIVSVLDKDYTSWHNVVLVVLLTRYCPEWFCLSTSSPIQHPSLIQMNHCWPK